MLTTSVLLAANFVEFGTDVSRIALFGRPRNPLIRNDYCSWSFTYGGQTQTDLFNCHIVKYLELRQ